MQPRASSWLEGTSKKGYAGTIRLAFELYRGDCALLLIARSRMWNIVIVLMPGADSADAPHVGSIRRPRLIAKKPVAASALLHDAARRYA
jgi:hypothetical protein